MVGKACAGSREAAGQDSDFFEDTFLPGMAIQGKGLHDLLFFQPQE